MGKKIYSTYRSHFYIRMKAITRLVSLIVLFLASIGYKHEACGAVKNMFMTSKSENIGLGSANNNTPDIELNKIKLDNVDNQNTKIEKTRKININESKKLFPNILKKLLHKKSSDDNKTTNLPESDSDDIEVLLFNKTTNLPESDSDDAEVLLFNNIPNLPESDSDDIEVLFFNKPPSLPESKKELTPTPSDETVITHNDQLYLLNSDDTVIEHQLTPEYSGYSTDSRSINKEFDDTSDLNEIKTDKPGVLRKFVNRFKDMYSTVEIRKLTKQNTKLQNDYNELQNDYNELEEQLSAQDRILLDERKCAQLVLRQFVCLVTKLKNCNDEIITFKKRYKKLEEMLPVLQKPANDLKFDDVKKFVQFFGGQAWQERNECLCNEIRLLEKKNAELEDREEKAINNSINLIKKYEDMHKIDADGYMNEVYALYEMVRDQDETTRDLEGQLSDILEKSDSSGSKFDVYKIFGDEDTSQYSSCNSSDYLGDGGSKNDYSQKSSHLDPSFSEKSLGGLSSATHSDESSDESIYIPEGYSTLEGLTCDAKNKSRRLFIHFFPHKNFDYEPPAVVANPHNVAGGLATISHHVDLLQKDAPGFTKVSGEDIDVNYEAPRNSHVAFGEKHIIEETRRLSAQSRGVVEFAPNKRNLVARNQVALEFVPNEDLGYTPSTNVDLINEKKLSLSNQSEISVLSNAGGLEYVAYDLFKAVNEEKLDLLSQSPVGFVQDDQVLEFKVGDILYAPEVQQKLQRTDHDTEILSQGDADPLITISEEVSSIISNGSELNMIECKPENLIQEEGVLGLTEHDHEGFVYDEKLVLDEYPSEDFIYDETKLNMIDYDARVLKYSAPKPMSVAEDVVSLVVGDPVLSDVGGENLNLVADKKKLQPMQRAVFDYDAPHQKLWFVENQVVNVINALKTADQPVQANPEMIAEETETDKTLISTAVEQTDDPEDNLGRAEYGMNGFVIESAEDSVYDALRVFWGDLDEDELYNPVFGVYAPDALLLKGPDSHDGEAQTDGVEAADFDAQTESPEVSTIGEQTENVATGEFETQTESPKVSEIGTQMSDDPFDFIARTTIAQNTSTTPVEAPRGDDFEEFSGAETQFKNSFETLTEAVSLGSSGGHGDSIGKDSESTNLKEMPDAPADGKSGAAQKTGDLVDERKVEAVIQPLENKAPNASSVETVAVSGANSSVTAKARSLGDVQTGAVVVQESQTLDHIGGKTPSAANIEAANSVPGGGQVYEAQPEETLVVVDVNKNNAKKKSAAVTIEQGDRGADERVEAKKQDTRGAHEAFGGGASEDSPMWKGYVRKLRSLLVLMWGGNPDKAGKSKSGSGSEHTGKDSLGRLKYSLNAGIGQHGITPDAVDVIAATAA